MRSKTAARATLVGAFVLTLAFATASAPGKHPQNRLRSVRVRTAAMLPLVPTGAPAFLGVPQVVDTPKVPEHVPTTTPPDVVYTVLPGEGLSEISVKVAVDWLRLCGRNHIAPPGYILYAGELLTVPGPNETVEPCVVQPDPSPQAVQSAAPNAPVQASAPAATPAATAPAPNGGSIEGIIRAAAARNKVSGDQLVRVAGCESGMNTQAVNYGYTAYYKGQPEHPSGLFQFLPSTFSHNGGSNIWSAYDQSDTAARMFSEGQSGQWSCK